MKVTFIGDTSKIQDNLTKGLFEIAMEYIKEGKGIEPKKTNSSEENIRK